MYSKINNKFNCKKLIVFLICVNILENSSFGNRERAVVYICLTYILCIVGKLYINIVDYPKISLGRRDDLM